MTSRPTALLARRLTADMLPPQQSNHQPRRNAGNEGARGMMDEAAFRPGVRVTIPARPHARPRTQKKWIKRFGTISFTIQIDYDSCMPPMKQVHRQVRMVRKLARLEDDGALDLIAFTEDL